MPVWAKIGAREGSTWGNSFFAPYVLFPRGSGANLPWCGALCVHRSGVPNHLQESLTSRKHLGQAKAKTTGGLGTALAKLRKTRHVSPGYSHPSTTGKASTAPACLPRLTRVACLSTSASSPCGTWYFGIETIERGSLIFLPLASFVARTLL